MNEKIIIREDFSDCPGARYRKDGPNSGEEFYENLLEPKFKNAKKNNTKLEIDLDGVWGYPSSFVSGSFGKLATQYSYKDVLAIIVFISKDSMTIKNRIISEITNPTRKE